MGRSIDELNGELRALRRNYEATAKEFGIDSREASVSREALFYAQDRLERAQRRAHTPTQRLALAAERVFGNEWAAPLARALARPARTIQRVRQLASRGGEYPAAGKLLEELREWLEFQARKIGNDQADADDDGTWGGAFDLDGRPREDR